MRRVRLTMTNTHGTTDATLRPGEEHVVRGLTGDTRLTAHIVEDCAGQHDFDVIVLGTGNPGAVICSNCGHQWGVVSDDESEVG